MCARRTGVLTLGGACARLERWRQRTVRSTLVRLDRGRPRVGSDGRIKLTESQSTISLRLFPLRVVLFPGMRLPLHIFEDRYRSMIRECLDANAPFGVVLIRSGHEVGGPAVVYPVGTLAKIEAVEHLDDGAMNIVVVGEHRFVITEVVQQTPFMSGRVSLLPTPDAAASRADLAALTARVVQGFSAYDRLKAQLDEDWEPQGDPPDDPAEVAYFIASAMPLPHTDKQALLAQNSLDDLLTHERDLLGVRSYHTSAVLAARQILDAQIEQHGPLPRPFNLN